MQSPIRSGGRVWRKLLAVVYVIGLLCTNASSGEPESEKQADSDPILVDASLVEIQPNHFEAVVQARRVTAGTTRTLEVTLRNPTGSVVELKNASATCGCVKAKLSENTIEPFDSAKIWIQISPPIMVRSTRWHQLLTFTSDDKLASRLRVPIRVDLLGVLGSPEASRTLQLLADESDAKNGESEVVSKSVGLIFTEPIQFDNLRVMGPPSLDLFEIKLASKGQNQASLTVSVESKRIPKEGVVTPIIVEDSRTGRRVEFGCVANYRSTIEVLPSQLRLKESPESQDLVGTALVAHHGIKESASKQDGDTKGEKPFIEASFGSSQAAVKMTTVRPGVVRAEIRLSKESLEREGDDGLPDEISWNVIWGKDRKLLNTKAIVVPVTFLGDKQ